MLLAALLLAAAPVDPLLLHAAFSTLESDGRKIDAARTLLASAKQTQPDATWLAALIGHGPKCASTSCVDIEVVKLSASGASFSVVARRRWMPELLEWQINTDKPELQWSQIQIAPDEAALGSTVRLGDPDRVSETTFLSIKDARVLLTVHELSSGAQADAQTEVSVEVAGR